MRIDASEALRVAGVIDVLTHENRPHMADTDDAYKDDVAPDRARRSVRSTTTRSCSAASRSRWWWPRNGRSRAIAASLVRVEYAAGRARHRPACAARRSRSSIDKPVEAARRRREGLRGGRVRHEAEYFVPIEHHNPMELYASTVIWDGDGKLTVYDKTQGVQNVQRYLCGVFDMKPDDVRVMSPFVGGAFGSGLRPQYQVVLAVLAARALKRSVRLVLTRQQMYALGYRPATIERLALGAKADGTLEAITHEAIAVTSQYEEFRRQRHRLGRACSTRAPNARYAHKLARLDLPTPCDMRAPGAATGVYALECAMDELAVALKLDPMRAAPAVLLGSRPERGHFRTPASSCANATARARRRSAGTSATPSRARCATAASWSAGAWRPASGRRCRCRPTVRIVLTANGHAEVAMRDVRHRHRHLHDHGADRGRHARPADRQHQRQARRLRRCRNRPVEGGSWIAASVSQCDRDHAPARSARSCSLWLQHAEDSPLAGATLDDVDAGRRQDRQPGAMRAAPCRLPMRCARQSGSHRAGEGQRACARTRHTPATPIRRSSPR